MHPTSVPGWAWRRRINSMTIDERAENLFEAIMCEHGGTDAVHAIIRSHLAEAIAAERELHTETIHRQGMRLLALQEAMLTQVANGRTP